MQAAVVVFPGSNREQDVVLALERSFGRKPLIVWHRDSELPKADLIVIPGGFSYGDYLRCGAMAAHSPIMRAIKERAGAGTPVVGICNGFQVLTEAGMLPGALLVNRTLKFHCRDVHLRVETSASLFTRGYNAGQVIRVPVAHHDGNYFADRATLDRLEGEGRVAFRYCAPDGALDDARQRQRLGARHRRRAQRDEDGARPHAASRGCDRSAPGLDRRARLLRRDRRSLRLSADVAPDIVAAHGLSPEEYQRAVAILGRAPNFTELGIFSVMWSEHCSYKSSRKWLRLLPTTGPRVICGPGENAGVVDIGDDDAVIFKMESHNHPSFIEPYQGAATGVGGILRDVFTMGARPIANLNALRFGSPEHAKTRHLVAGVVAGIGGYGNCVGVPTVGGECNFHRCYDGNILVNAMTVGLASKHRIFYSKAAGAGQSRGLCRRQDRARRHPRRHHGVGRVQRRQRGQAPDRAGRRSLHREAADRGVPRADGGRRHRRDPGHGRGRPHLVLGRDGGQGRARHRARSGSCAGARDRHERLRDHALRKPGAHAHDPEARARRTRRGACSRNGNWISR